MTKSSYGIDCGMCQAAISTFVGRDWTPEAGTAMREHDHVCPNRRQDLKDLNGAKEAA